MTRFRTAVRRRHLDEGYTLTELLVSMAIFGILLSLVAAATMMMSHDLTRQTGQTDNLDRSRKIMSVLDKQARYANAINNPATGTDGNLYVEWRSGNTNQQQTCYQWRWVTSKHTLQYRKWLEPFGASSNTTPTAWAPVGDGVYQSGSTQIFAISSPFVQTPPPPTGPSREVLTVTFVSKHGNPVSSQFNQASWTAFNSSGAVAPGNPVCKENGEP